MLVYQTLVLLNDVDVACNHQMMYSYETILYIMLLSHVIIQSCMTKTRYMEFSYLICGFQGSNMSSNHTNLTRERVCVSMCVQNGVLGPESSVVGIPVSVWGV